MEQAQAQGQGQQQITLEKVHQIIGKVVFDASMREEQLMSLLQQQGQQMEQMKKTSEVEL